jgi:Acetyltransferase (GNAT) domain
VTASHTTPTIGVEGTELPPGDYELRDQTIACKLGPVTAFKPRFRLRVWNIGLVTGMVFGGDFTDAVLGDSESDGFLLRSLPIAQHLPRVVERGRLLQYVPSQYPRHYVDLARGLDAYVGKFSPKSLATLRRKVRHFAQESGGSLDLRVYATPAELASYYPIARALSERTYQETQFQWGLPDSPEFHAEMMEAAARGEARGYLLFRGECAVSYLYCPVHDGIISYQYVGYDQDFADSSPGTVLLWSVLERLLMEGKHRLFDFTQGDGDHKRFFATGSQLCADVYLLRRTTRNRVCVRSHMACSDLSDFGVGVLEHAGAKAAVKRFLYHRGRVSGARRTRVG